jgi:hypothetical protein
MALRLLGFLGGTRKSDQRTNTGLVLHMDG